MFPALRGDGPVDFDFVVSLILFILFFPILVVLFIAYLPILAISSLINVCMNNTNNTITTESTIIHPALKNRLTEIQGKYLDENKKQQANALVDAAGNKIAINSEIKKELLTLRKEVRKDFTKQEYDALKKTLYQHTKELGRMTSNKNLFFTKNETQKYRLIRPQANQQNKISLLRAGK